MDYNIDYYMSELFSGAIILAIIVILLILSLLVLRIIALWKLFKKAGKPGWASIIPFYNSYVLVEIAGLNWWWFLLLIFYASVSFEVEGLSFIITIGGFLASFNCYYNISKKFGKDNTFSVFAGLFNFIFLLILGLSKKEVYDSNIPVSPNGVFGKPENNVKNNSQKNSSIINEHGNNNTTSNYCGNCGTKLDDEAKFCPNCGKEKR